MKKYALIFKPTAGGYLSKSGDFRGPAFARKFETRALAKRYIKERLTGEYEIKVRYKV